MDKKELQRQRMKTYFIDSAKAIIMEEGVMALSARKVGEKAGYSYATIYNYFTDINALLYYCLFDFLEDAYKYLLSYRDEALDAKQQLLTYTTEYFRYFAERPEIFRLVFIASLGPLPEEIAHNPQVSVAELLGEALVACTKAGYFEEGDIQVAAELIASSIHGKLMFFIQDRILDGETAEMIIKMIEAEIEYMSRK